MKRITRITSIGLKGRSFDIELAPVTVLVGDSFSGKTAVLDALRCALTGKLEKRFERALRLNGGEIVVLGYSPDLSIATERHWRLERETIKQFGDTRPIVQSMMLDCREYLGLTAAQRTAHVFGLLDTEKLKITNDRLVAELRSIRPEAPDENTEAAMNWCATDVSELLRISPKSTIQDLAAIITRFRAEKKETDAAVKRFVGMVQGGAQLRIEEPTRNVDKELAEARNKLDKAREALRSLEREHQEREKRQKRIAVLTEVLKKVPDYPVQIETTKEKADALEKKIAGKKPNAVATMKALNKASEAVRNAKSDINRIVIQIDALNEKHAMDMKHSACPFCKSNRQGWQENIIKSYKEQLNVFNDVLTRTNDCLKAAIKVEADARKKHDAAMKKADFVNATMDTIQQLRRDLDGMKESLDECAKERTELALLEEQEAKAQPGTDKLIAVTKDRCFKLAAQVDDLDAAQKRYVAEKAKESQVLKAKLEQAEQKARSEVLKLALVKVEDLQKEMIEAGVGGLMSKVNLFTKGILKAPLEWRDGEIGYYAGGSWVSHESFSGTEEAIAYCGLSVALAKDAPLRIVIIDEMGIMDGNSRALAAQRMVQLVKAGEIDQAVLCDVPPPSWGVKQIGEWYESLGCKAVAV